MKWTPASAMPEPSGDHAVPFHCATQLAETPPAVVKKPPATTSPLASPVTALTIAFIPEPNGDHAVPFQRAMRLAPTPPAIVKSPAATRSPLGSVVRAITELL